jgi:hypothetical protein
VESCDNDDTDDRTNDDLHAAPLLGTWDTISGETIRRCDANDEFNILHQQPRTYAFGVLDELLVLV